MISDLKLSKAKEPKPCTPKVGDSVKVCLNDVERVWLEITSISGGSLKGKIDSPSYIMPNINLGEEIVFASENILDYLKN